METNKVVFGLTDERRKIIKKIHRNIDLCTLEDRKAIINLISQYISKEDMSETQMGINIFYKFMNNELLRTIYNLIQKSKKKNELNLDG